MLRVSEGQINADLPQGHSFQANVCKEQKTEKIFPPIPNKK